MEKNLDSIIKILLVVLFISIIWFIMSSSSECYDVPSDSNYTFNQDRASKNPMGDTSEWMMKLQNPPDCTLILNNFLTNPSQQAEQDLYNCYHNPEEKMKIKQIGLNYTGAR